MKKISKKKITFVAIVIVCLVISFITWKGIAFSGQKEENTIVTIAIPERNMVQNIDANYYKLWLEKKTGYRLLFETFPEGYEREYLYTMLTAEDNPVDAVFLPENQELFTMEEFSSYARKGLIWKLPESDGAMDYFYPRIDTTRKKRNLQVMWMNIGWLSKLGLEIPRTPDELEQVLLEFKKNDPNGNGLADELPLLSCEEQYSLQSYNYILNAFTFNDPVHARLYLDQTGTLRYAAREDTFRDGLTFCRRLYQEGALSDVCFFSTRDEMKEIVNAPEDLVGAFTSQSIADVIYSSCTDVVARYIQVPPLKGENGEQNAVRIDYETEIGGYIPSNSKHKEEAAKVMECMLQEDASLIAQFGEEGVDWKYSEGGDLSTYGTRAQITTINYIQNTMQNQNFGGMGPLVLDEKYANGVTWNGNHSLVEYLDARAVKAYEEYYQGDLGDLVQYLDTNDLSDIQNLQETIDLWIRHFIMGELDSEDENTWKQFQKSYEEWKCR